MHSGSCCAESSLSPLTEKLVQLLELIWLDNPIKTVVIPVAGVHSDQPASLAISFLEGVNDCLLDICQVSMVSLYVLFMFM